MQTYVDDARVRARAEHNQSQIAHVRHQHALVHQQRIGFPRRVGARSREMVDATFLERRDRRYLSAVIEMVIEQQPSIRVVDHLRAALLEFARARNVGDRHHHAALEPDGAFVEHAGIDLDGDATAVFHDRLDRVRKRGHVIPMSMADGNRLDFAQPDSEIGAVADEDRPFRPGIEQQGMPHVLGLRHELETKTEVGAQQRLAGNHLRPGHDDIGKLGDREQRLADVSVADIVGDHLNDERIDGLGSGRWRFGCGHFGRLSMQASTILYAPICHNRGHGMADV
jgi:hypothetical protein